MDTFTCKICRLEKPVQTNGGTGYAVDNQGQKVCYACCAYVDRQEMVKEGRIVLYLTCEPAYFVKHPLGRKTRGTVSNWPGTLTFNCHTRTGKHNIAGIRYDCWFTGPDGYEWYGVGYGENSQIVRCQRTKKKADPKSCLTEV